MVNSYDIQYYKLGHTTVYNSNLNPIMIAKTYILYAIHCYFNAYSIIMSCQDVKGVMMFELK